MTIRPRWFRRANALGDDAPRGDALPIDTPPIDAPPVGARSAPVDTSWGTTLDVNGDGFADLVVGAPLADPRGGADAGTATVYYYSRSCRYCACGAARA